MELQGQKYYPHYFRWVEPSTFLISVTQVLWYLLLPFVIYRQSIIMIPAQNFSKNLREYDKDTCFYTSTLTNSYISGTMREFVLFCNSLKNFTSKKLRILVTNTLMYPKVRICTGSSNDYCMIHWLTSDYGHRTISNDS